MTLPVSPNARDIGECVYCGARDVPLQKEHAIPYGLNGEWTLLRASCSRCAGITHRFERDVLRCLWPLIRAGLSMRTRRPAQRSNTLPLIVRRDGKDETIQIPRAECPIYLPTPVFPEPGAMTGRRLQPGVFTKLDALHIAGPTFREVSDRYPGATLVAVNTNFAPEDFARMIAKIAFCMAIHVLGIAPFKSTPIRNIILGSDQNIGHWVGGWHGDEQNPPRGSHAIRITARGSEIHAIIRLFAQFGAPEYHVAVGEADPEFVASDQWPEAWRSVKETDISKPQSI